MRDLIFVLISLYCLPFGGCGNLKTDSYHQFQIKKIDTGRFQIILLKFTVFAKSYRRSPRYVLPGKRVLKICSKFTGEYQCRSVISKKLFCKFTEIILRYEYFPLNLLLNFRVPSSKITLSGMSFGLAKLLRIKTGLHKFLFFYQRFLSLFAIL